jgi:hypothetical protein
MFDKQTIGVVAYNIASDEIYKWLDTTDSNDRGHPVYDDFITDP